jgi:hypothetical protein
VRGGPRPSAPARGLPGALPRAGPRPPAPARGLPGALPRAGPRPPAPTRGGPGQPARGGSPVGWFPPDRSGPADCPSGDWRERGEPREARSPDARRAVRRRGAPGSARATREPPAGPRPRPPLPPRRRPSATSSRRSSRCDALRRGSIPSRSRARNACRSTTSAIGSCQIRSACSLSIRSAWLPPIRSCAVPGPGASYRHRTTRQRRPWRPAPPREPLPSPHRRLSARRPVRRRPPGGAAPWRGATPPLRWRRPRPPPPGPCSRLLPLQFLLSPRHQVPAASRRQPWSDSSEVIAGFPSHNTLVTG